MVAQGQACLRTLYPTYPTYRLPAYLQQVIYGYVYGQMY